MACVRRGAKERESTPRPPPLESSHRAATQTLHLLLGTVGPLGHYCTTCTSARAHKLLSIVALALGHGTLWHKRLCTSSNNARALVHERLCNFCVAPKRSCNSRKKGKEFDLKKVKMQPKWGSAWALQQKPLLNASSVGCPTSRHYSAVTQQLLSKNAAFLSYQTPTESGQSCETIGLFPFLLIFLIETKQIETFHIGTCTRGWALYNAQALEKRDAHRVRLHTAEKVRK